MKKIKFLLDKYNKPNHAKIQENMNNDIKELLATGKEIAVEIKNIIKEPTDEVRGYYFGIVLCMIKNGLHELGNHHFKDINEIDDYMRKKLCFGELERTRTNLEETIEFKKNSLSNKKGDKKEIWDYINECRSWAREHLGIDIPKPEKHEYLR